MLRKFLYVTIWFTLIWGGFLLATDPLALIVLLRGRNAFESAILVADGDDRGCKRSGDDPWTCHTTGQIKAPGNAIDQRIVRFEWQAEDSGIPHPGTEVAIWVVALRWWPEIVPLPTTKPIPDLREWLLVRSKPGGSLFWPLLAFLILILVLVLDLLGRAMGWRREGRLELYRDGGFPGCAGAIVGVAIPVAVLGPGPSFVGALVLLAISWLILVRKFVVLDARHRTLEQGSRWLVFTKMAKSSVNIDQATSVRVRQAKRDIKVVLQFEKGSYKVLQIVKSKAVAHRGARRAADLLDLPLKGAGPQPARRTKSGRDKATSRPSHQHQARSSHPVQQGCLSRFVGGSIVVLTIGGLLWWLTFGRSPLVVRVPSAASIAVSGR